MFVLICMIMIIILFVLKSPTIQFNTNKQTQVDLLQVMIILFSGFVSYNQEKAFREDFLLQFDYREEQTRSQIILDNIMPPYITKQMKEQNQSKFVWGGWVCECFVLFCFVLFCFVFFIYLFILYLCRTTKC